MLMPGFRHKNQFQFDRNVSFHFMSNVNSDPFSKFYILWSYLELVLFFDNKSPFHKIDELLLSLFHMCSLKIRSHEYTFNPS